MLSLALGAVPKTYHAVKAIEVRNAANWATYTAPRWPFGSKYIKNLGHVNLRMFNFFSRLFIFCLCYFVFFFRF